MAHQVRRSLSIVAVLAGALTAAAGAAAQSAHGSLANDESLFVDGKTFEIRGGPTTGDPAAQVGALGAREFGSGALIFRSGGKLYVARGDARLAPPPPQGRVHVVYEEPKDPALARIRDMVMERHGLERFSEILSPFRLPEDVYVRAVSCDGVPNAYFFRENDIPTIRICYEYLKQVEERLPKETTKEGIEPHEALIGQLVFALLHEFGHAAFDIYNIPVFGRQEDAADEFATYIMLQFGGETAHRLIRGAAYSYLGVIKDFKDDPRVTRPLVAFSSDHGSPEERFYNLACIAYGYDPEIFHRVVDFDYLPQRRAKVCKYEYSNLRYAFRALIMPHVDTDQVKKVIALSLFVPEEEDIPLGP
jgi:hypothetical protein